jgi:sRNA-binding carbon storage regulator CsrA
VLEIRGSRVRIGIDAPNDIHVFRAELHALGSDTSGNGSRVAVASTESHDQRGTAAWDTEGAPLTPLCQPD